MDKPRRSRPTLLLLSIPTSLLLIFFTLFLLKLKTTSQTTPLHLHKHDQLNTLAARSACRGTRYPALCVSTVSSFPGLAAKTLPQIISSTVSHAVGEARASSDSCVGVEKKLLRSKTLDPIQKQALDDCAELLDDTVAELGSVLADLASKMSASKHFHDIETLLSGAMTNQYTCLDGFSTAADKRVRSYIEGRIAIIASHVSNILVMVKKIKGKHEVTAPARRLRVLPEGYGQMKGGFPGWVSSGDRRRLQSARNETKYDVVVAKDGSGNFTTVGEAVAAAPNNSETRYVIYIKAGAYLENVEVVRKKTNLFFLGDGIGKTVIKGSRNHVDGWTTFRSATVAVVGNGFMAKGVTFENSAGPGKHQAVAMRSGSDLSTFYQCSFVGYQDTLYAHSLRQFYRDCDVYGTVDFVFGNAAAVLQNCNLYARRPNPKQHNIFTAQGREDPNQNTGLSLVGCKIAAGSDLAPVKSDFKNYLGRPWKEFSRTVIMKSYIDDLIHPSGWLEWNASFALNTLYYGEYMNRGPGSNTSARVSWPGYRVINSSAEASMFTVEAFIQGREWLNSTKVPYSATLS